MRLLPEVVIMDDETLARLGPSIDRYVEAVERVWTYDADFAEKAQRNGWDARSIALGRMFSDLDSPEEP